METNNSSLLTWIGTFGTKTPSSFSELCDAKLISDAATSMIQNLKISSTQTPKEKFSALRVSIEECFGKTLSEIDADILIDCDNSEQSMIRLLQLLLCVGTQGESSILVVNALQRMSESDQLSLMDHIATTLPTLGLSVPTVPGTPIRSLHATPLVHRATARTGAAFSPMMSISRVRTPAYGFTPEPKGNEVASLREQLRLVHEQLDEAVTLHDEVAKELTVKTQALEELTIKYQKANLSTERVQALQDQVDTMGPQVQRLERHEAELQRLRDYVSAAKTDQRDLVATRQDLSKAHAECNEMASKVKLLEDQVKEYRTKFAQQEVKILQFGQLTTLKDAELSRLMAENEALRQDKVELAREMLRERSETEELKGKFLEELKYYQETAPSNSTITDVMAETAKLRELLKEASEEAQRMSVEQAHAQERINELVAVGEEKQSYYEKEINTLKTLLSEQKKESIALQKESIALQKQSAESTSSMQSLQTKLRFTEEALEMAQNDVTRAKEDRRESLVRAYQFDADKKIGALLAAQKELMHNHNTELEKLENEHNMTVNNLQSVISDFKAQVEFLHRALEAAKREHNTPARAPFVVSSPAPALTPMLKQDQHQQQQYQQQQQQQQQQAPSGAIGKPLIDTNETTTAAPKQTNIPLLGGRPALKPVNFLAWDTDDSRVNQLKDRNARQPHHLRESYSTQVMYQDKPKDVVTPPQPKGIASKPLPPHLQQSSIFGDSPVSAIIQKKAVALEIPADRPKAAMPARLAGRLKKQ